MLLLIQNHLKHCIPFEIQIGISLFSLCKLLHAFFVTKGSPELLTHTYTHTQFDKFSGFSKAANIFLR